MKSKLKALLKSNRICYLIYFYIGSIVLKIVGVFIKTNPKQIMFVSYGGKFTDSPVNIYNYLIKHDKFKDYKLIWALTNPKDYPQIDITVTIDTPKFYIEAIRSGLWITNSSVSRGLNFKKRKTKYVNFVHGVTAMKRNGVDIKSKKKTFINGFKEKFNVIYVQGINDIELLSQAWERPKKEFLNLGLPRNDLLVNYGKSSIKILKDKFNIPNNKQVILYAPTFREESRDKNNYNFLKLPFNLDYLYKELSEQFILILTAHYEIHSYDKSVNNNDFLINALHYPEINDLLLISDILITDYSSVSFDYSILERPILCYSKDYDVYKQKRGFYIDPKEIFNHGVINNEKELINIINNMNYEKESEYTKKYIKEKYLINIDGKSTERIVENIYKNYLNEQK